MSDQIEEAIKIRLMNDRRYMRIPVDSIVVVNSRDRDQKQFEENVRSIGAVGLLKPIMVNDKFFEKTGKYELVFGEGRWLGYIKLGKTEIEADVVSITRKEALLISLIENIARVPHGTMWFAREVVRMNKAGMTTQEIAQILGRSPSYVGSYITLAERGEDRLIRGVEQEIFPMAFAHRVAEAGDAEIQNILMDAYDSDVVTSANFTQVKRVINSRFTQHVNRKDPGGHKDAAYTVEQLKRDISRITREKQSYVKEAERKESRLFAIVGALEPLMQSQEFVGLLTAEGLQVRPVLAGSYGSVISDGHIKLTSGGSNDDAQTSGN